MSNSMKSLDLNSGRAVYGRLLSYVKPYLGAFIFAIVGMLIVAATEVGFAALMQPMLDGNFVDKNPDTIMLVPILIISVFLIRGVGSFAVTFCMAWVGRHVIKDLRKEMFEHFLCLPTRFYDNHASGQLISKLIYDAEQVADASSRAITVLIQDSLTIIGLLAWMFYIEWQLALLFLVLGPLLSVLVVGVNKRLRRISKRLQNSVGDVTHITQETIEAQRVIKVFGGQHHEREKFVVANENNRRQFMKIVMTNAASVPIVQLMAACLLAAIVYIASRPETQEQISVGVFMSFITAMLLLFPPLKRLTTVNAILQRGIAASQSIFAFLLEEKEKNTGTDVIADSQGQVEFKNVYFRYNDQSGDVLNNISFSVSPGQVIAFVGKSGSGKSTLVSLLPRFYNISQGEICLDGININAIELTRLRQQIALVSQEITLFNDTVRHNIAYGRLETASEARIVQAAKFAHAMEFIEQLPKGLDTMVGEHGVLLSGGQRQRLAIARAILKDAPVLILDEATSSLDTESERYIQSALDSLMKSRTTFVIAHRLSTIEQADIIIVMHQGSIVEMGDHQTLIKQGGHYATLHKMQFRESE